MLPGLVFRDPKDPEQFNPSIHRTTFRTTHLNYGMAGSSRRMLVVGVDFGATFSGVAWAATSGDSSSDVQVIIQWPNIAGRDRLRHSEKVPTKLRRVGNGELQWGFLVSPDAPDAEILHWFKL